MTKVNKERKATLYYLRKTVAQFEHFADQFKNADNAKPFRDAACAFRQLAEEIEHGDHVKLYNRYADKETE